MNIKRIKLNYLYDYINGKVKKKLITKNFSHSVSVFKDLIVKKKKQFNDVWFLNNLVIFENFFPKNKKYNFKYLEIGCHEGMSLLYVLENYKRVLATGIDVWSGKKYSLTEKIFDKNISGYKNFLKIKKDSIVALRELNHNNFFFDYIYIDGLHLGEHVIVDAVESFKVLKNNGIMIFDDFLQFDASRKYQTYEAIFYFLQFFKNNLRILYFQNILVIKKIKN
jgi:hypothetical protein